jgi:N-acetyl-D-muramate 6-phosphate phosphatase
MARKKSASFHTRAVLFDLDGTFADTAPDMARALNHVRATHDLPPLAVAMLRPHVSSGARGMIGAGFDITPEDARFSALRDAFLDFYERNVCIETILFAGITELVDTLDKREIKWGIVTNKGRRFTFPLLEQLDMHLRAGCIVCGDSTAHAKPHPAPLFHAAEILGVLPSESLYVGDDERDVQAARAADMGIVVARYGYLGTGNPPEDWGADALIDAPLDTLRHL